MKTIATLATTVVCLTLPAFPQTNGELSKRSPNYEPYREIEKKYYHGGPWKDVTVGETDQPCDSAGNKCLLIYPTNLGAKGFKHSHCCIWKWHERQSH
jgi:hypothetical protein